VASYGVAKDLANMGKLYLFKQNTASSKGVKGQL